METQQQGGKENGRMHMEGSLSARDKVGVQDFVLLDSHTSEAAFMDNLRKRFQENLIYTYIGTMLVSVNPYQELQLYTQRQMELYQGVNFIELPPHIYAVADNAYRVMCTERNNHFILISGESGSGKTETSKKILQYLAMTCPVTEKLQTIRDRLLLSNPVLEAFGNAKTIRNDNSSRFGKYMDVQFDYKGAPAGGHILSYLIEKSRVVHQNPGERNFHIFYQLLEGGEDHLIRWLGLERNPQMYSYLIQGECAKVSSICDKTNWKLVRRAFTIIEFTEADIEHLFGIVASVLHLGNIKYEEDTHGHAIIRNGSQMQWISKLLGVPVSILQEALTNKKIEARSEEVLSPLNLELAYYARDALAKAIYGRSFNWLVNKINSSLANKDPPKKTVIGLLDIYGFEVFETNSFEQFCINYCNEKLQQLFISMTLKAEQEEYEIEGIEWEPVQYFDNKIICDLIEEKYKGIIAIMDEECLRPGEATDLSFLAKLEEKVGDHPHFLTRKLADPVARKTIDWVDFRLIHYAGEVTYCAVGFLEKNNDLLYRNLKEVVLKSKNYILRDCFHPTELDNRRRPETVTTQFKNSLSSLIEILLLKEPTYIRCIKPNNTKQPGKFEDMLVRHQVKYLGLMEHLRVRRAGFAYRRKYEIFLERYKSLCPQTWPNWAGPAREGVEKLVKYLGYQPNEYKLGRTKLFIRFPRTLFATVDSFEIRKHQLVSKIQAKYKGCLGKRAFEKKKKAAIKLESCWRGVLARREAKKRAWAVQTIRKFIVGFINRKNPDADTNKNFFGMMYYNYLWKLREHVPKNVLDKRWLTPPVAMEKTSELLHKLCIRNLVRKYCRTITPQRTHQLQQKVVTSQIFKGKKEGYKQSLCQPFEETRLSEQDINPKVLQLMNYDRIKYGIAAVKYDRHGFKARPRQLLLTQSAAYVTEQAKIKQKIEYSGLKGISVSNLNDGFLIIHVSPEDNKQKGDAILQCDHIFEAVTKLCMLASKQDAVTIAQGSLTFHFQGKEGIIDFTHGAEAQVYKAKNGHLTVATPRLKS
ncbi:unconventional myosin-Ih [Xenopus tropicalis]|uniref:Unconventional myosin-Ih n=1 Tax=Xenopus tropicalis TaxID=8364 RepID=A0A8J0T041_XENTR|nr:unconventional myosin-Ih [Xenopus tropicalis]|eukprot:XP_017945451.1 PREDICTED: unconventional myosin-Ih [Xenopus tropicalis]